MLPYVLEKKLKTRRLDRLQMCQSALQQYRLAYHSSSSCFAQFCDFDLLLLKFCFIEGPYALRFFKIHIDCWTRGIWPCLIHFQKKKKITVIVFLKNKKASISKLGAFGHASFIFKKKKKIKISKDHASISKLGAFGQASSILEKKKNHLFLKSQGFQNHASICRLGLQVTRILSWWRKVLLEKTPLGEFQVTTPEGSTNQELRGYKYKESYPTQPIPKYLPIVEHIDLY